MECLRLAFVLKHELFLFKFVKGRKKQPNHTNKLCLKQRHDHWHTVLNLKVRYDVPNADRQKQYGR